ncbi:33877_t:CDS:1 [Racocetra persica]|uniref:33877_t:CDS:1 n=1 Tax=Racocetra persica TaxID=160502 RepID=A0ACA9M9Q5_9GLOM|nr:33877_t:CDS:1 [Racocetra persica]
MAIILILYTLQYFNNLKIPAYDAYLSSLSSDDHSRRYCKLCGKYFPTTVMLAKHKKAIHSSTRTRHSEQRSQTNLTTFNDFSLLPSLSESWPQVVIMLSQSFSDIE